MPQLPDLGSILLAPTLAPLCAGSGPVPPSPREVLRELGRREFRSIRLSAAQPGLRPRDLDRSARRDLLAQLRRNEMEAAGVDLLIPPAHYVEPAHADRAAEALLAAVDFAAELGPVALTVNLPADLSDGLLEALRGRADITGTPIADIGAFGEVLGHAIDPAAILARSEDPARLASQVRMLHDARFSDAGGGLRVPPGEGDLDLLSYRLALETRGDVRWLTVDLRYLPEPWQVLERARHAWAGAIGGAGRWHL